MIYTGIRFYNLIHKNCNYDLKGKEMASSQNQWSQKLHRRFMTHQTIKASLISKFLFPPHPEVLEDFQLELYLRITKKAEVIKGCFYIRMLDHKGKGRSKCEKLTCLNHLLQQKLRHQGNRCGNCTCTQPHSSPAVCSGYTCIVEKPSCHHFNLKSLVFVGHLKQDNQLLYNMSAI